MRLSAGLLFAAVLSACSPMLEGDPPPAEVLVRVTEVSSVPIPGASLIYSDSTVAVTDSIGVAELFALDGWAWGAPPSGTLITTAAGFAPDTTDFASATPYSSRPYVFSLSVSLEALP